MIEELKKIIPSIETSMDPSDLEEYGRDWTRKHKPNPKYIVFPKSTEEVSKILKYCHQNNLSVVPSGGRTGLAGGAIASQGEIVLSFSKMNKLGEVDVVARTLRVQSGAVTEAVHQHCEKSGLTWPIDFGSKGSSQVGGNISTNAGGVRVIRYGLTRNWVLGLQVVLANGEVLELNGALEKNNTGPDLRQIFIGSEGTLGVITEATLKLCALPKTAEVFLLGVKNIEDVLICFKNVRSENFIVNAFEFMAKNCIESVRDQIGIRSPFKEIPAYSILLEIERPDREEAQNQLDEWLEGLFEKNLVLEGIRAESTEQAKEIWKIRESITESLAKQSLVHKHDIALPVSELSSFINDFNSELLKHKGVLEVFVFGHIGDGNLHVNYLKPKSLEKETFFIACEKLDLDMFKILQKYKGSVSAEHGIGLLKKNMLQYSRTQTEIEIFKKLKQLFDPKGILNPGKIL